MSPRRPLSRPSSVTSRAAIDARSWPGAAAPPASHWAATRARLPLSPSWHPASATAASSTAIRRYDLTTNDICLTTNDDGFTRNDLRAARASWAALLAAVHGEAVPGRDVERARARRAVEVEAADVVRRH